MKRAPLLFIFISPLFLVASSPALAAEKDDAQRPSSDAHLRGLELTVRPTFGGVGGDAPVTVRDRDAPLALQSGSSAYKWAAGVGAQIGWRFHPFVSAGLRADYASVGTEDVSGLAKDLSREAMGAGLYARIYPLATNESVRRHVDPWLSVGAGYARDVVSFKWTERATTFDIEAQRHAIAIPIGIGFDYRATEWFSVGPSFEYVLVNPVAGCLKASVGARSEQTCTESSNDLVASSAGAWNGGITLRVTPF